MRTRKGADQPTSAGGYSYSRGWRLLSEIVLHPGVRLLIRNKWSGQENLPRTGGIILAPNHLSYADWATIALFSSSYAHRYPVFMIKSGIFEVKVIGPMMYKFGQLPVYRGRGDAGLVLKQAAEALAAGACVIVYPEGTATRDPDLWPMVGRTGAARLALTTGAPVVPVAHWGAQDILPYGSSKPHLFPRKTVRMVAGPPVDLSAYAGQRLGASTLRAATADIMADITGLLAKIRQQTPPAVPYDPADQAQIPPGRTDDGSPAPSGDGQPAEAQAGEAQAGEAQAAEGGASEGGASEGGASEGGAPAAGQA
jgi:1-acyl-sn-glycerol-3-phosphate acyltransferase